MAEFAEFDVRRKARSVAEGRILGAGWIPGETAKDLVWIVRGVVAILSALVQTSSISTLQAAISSALRRHPAQHLCSCPGHSVGALTFSRLCFSGALFWTEAVRETQRSYEVAAGRVVNGRLWRFISVSSTVIQALLRAALIHDLLYLARMHGVVFWVSVAVALASLLAFHACSSRWALRLAFTRRQFEEGIVSSFSLALGATVYAHHSLLFLTQA